MPVPCTIDIARQPDFSTTLRFARNDMVRDIPFARNNMVGCTLHETTKGPIVIPTGEMRSIAQWRNLASNRKDYTIAVNLI
ncbi:hypothetical protein ACFL3Q_11250 [Planctomycetota bacterium]